MKYAVLAALILPGIASAQTARVVKVRGQKAVIQFLNAPAKVGDTVSVSNSSNSLASPLRERQSGLSWKYSGVTTKTKGTAGTNSSTTKSDEQSFEVAYLYNLGLFEFGAYVDVDHSKSSSSEGKGTEFGLLAQFNFIENTPDNDFVPYLRADIAALAGTVGDGSGQKMDIEGSSWGMRLGLMWFPFSEIFALDLGYEFGNAKMTTKSSPEIKFDITKSGLFAGWRIYF